ncbi:MAG: CDP-alcohol phosphatidyltransferase family protein [Pseudomonadales bacterium]|jgi:CDP-diacylglycerol--glycerol-3-phosphate 3-phosphatidyltransferase|nr:CDP-alcohol phosphatidyltransferase family protein [Pseudomonadales bacterium]
MKSLTHDLPSTRELRWLAPIGLVCLVLPALLPAHEAPGAFNALHWALAAWGFWLPIWFLAWQRRAHNRSDEKAAPFRDLGWGNRLTLLRGLLLAALGGFALQPAGTPWLPAACYGSAALLDRLDGEVARRTRHCSELGAALDTLYDALGLVLAPLVALRLGKLHESYLLTSVAYYWFVAGLYWRRWHEQPVHPLLPSALRRTLAGCQMGFVALVLWPTLAAPLTRWLGLCFMLPLLLGFMRDWWQVSGRYDPQSPANTARRQRCSAILEFSVLPGLRAVLMVALLLSPTLSWPVAVLAVALGAGWLTRLASILLLVLLAWDFQGSSVAALTLLQSASAVALLLLGGGRFSLWRADDTLLRRTTAA